MRAARHHDHGPELAAAVAAPGDADGMAFGVVGLPVGSGDRNPDVSERGVDPLEGRHAGRPAPGAGAGRPVVAAGMAEGGPAGEGVGHDLGAAGGRPVLYAACDLVLAEAPDRNRLGLARSAIGTGRDRGQERRPAGCAHPRLPPERAPPR